MRYVFVRAINSAFYSYGQWRNSCSYCRDNSTWSPRWTKQIFSLKSSPAEQAFPFFSFVCFQWTEMQRRERHEKQDTRSPHPCNLSLEKYKLTKKHSGAMILGSYPSLCRQRGQQTFSFQHMEVLRRKERREQSTWFLGTPSVSSPR